MPESPATRQSLPTLVSELKDLLVAYVRQETIVPIKGLGRFIAFGVAGSAALSLGFLLLVLALLRFLQAETGRTFSGRFSWAPYLIALVVSAAVLGGAARAMKGGRERAGAGR